MASTSAEIQVVEFIAALSKAWRKLAAYPHGHPEVTNSLDALNARLAELRGPAGEVVLGVSANALVYGNLDLTSAAAQKLAHTLYSRGIAIIRFASETTMDEVETFLRLLGIGGSADPKRMLWDELTANGVVNINLQPVSYGTVQVTEGAKEKEEDKERSLWDEVLRALLNNQQFAETWRDSVAHINSADELAKMIAEYAATEAEKAMPATAQASFGIALKSKQEDVFHRFFFQTVGNYISTATSMKKQNSLEQAMQLLRSLPEAMRRPLICAIAEALSNEETSAALLRDFASELPTDEVLDALRYLSSMDRLSGHSLMLLRSMTTIEASRTETVSEDVLADVIRLFGEDDVTRFNPTDHDAILRRVSVEIPMMPVEGVTGIQQAGDAIDPAEQVQILLHFSFVILDLIDDPDMTAPPAKILGRLDESFPALLDGEEYEHLEEVIKRLGSLVSTGRNDEIRQAARLSLLQMSDKVVDRASGATDEQLAKLRRLIDALGEHARVGFLERLAVESNRSKRRRLLNYIAAQGPAIVPQVIKYLGDERWYVVRNMIILLRAVKDQTSVQEIRKLARHPDLRVRMEAIKSLFQLDANVPPTLLDNLFNDRDPKIGQTAVALAGSYGIREAVDPLLRILQENDYLGTNRQLRIKAVKALGEIGDPRALGSLQKFFAFSLLPWPPKEERYAAWESLAGYPPDARKKLVEAGLKSSDGYIKEICSHFKST